MAPLPPPPPPPPRLPSAAQSQQGVHVVTTTYDHDRSRWGMGDAVVTMVIFFGASTVLGVLAFAASDGDGLDGAWLPLTIAVPAVLQLAHLGWVANAKGLGLVRDFRLQITWSDVAKGLGMWLSGLILAGIVASIIFALVDDSPTAAAADLAQDSGDDGGLTIWIVLFAILGSTLIPLVEELVYRGIWWSALEKRGVGNVATLFITSGIFAIVHLEPLRTPVLFVLALCIGLGRLVTGRIGASIVAHALVNTLGMIAVVAEIA